MFQRLRHIILLFFLASIGGVGAEESPDKVGSATSHKSLATKILDWFAESNSDVPARGMSVSVIGGPFYSSDTKFGVGLVVAGQYHHGTDTLSLPSIVSAKAKLSTTLFYGIGAEGMHIFPGDKMRLLYNFDFQSMPTYFWGIGYASGRNKDNNTKYIDQRINLSADALYRLYGPLFAGAVIQGCYVRAKDIRKPEFWENLPEHVLGFAIGGEIRYDSRDVPQNAYSGWDVMFAGKWWPYFLGNHNSFGSIDFTAAHYNTIWKGGVLAGRLHSKFTINDTPWAMMPTLGGSCTMRGYYEGQYRDKNAFDFTLELRQHIWRRSGAVVWAGFGSVFPKFSALRFKQLLPNAGVGYRWEFKKRINVRLDFGVGKGCYAVEFGLHEAF